VSTDDQTTRLQLDALKAAGCDPVFEESESGARRSRPQLDRALGELRPGDTLVVWKLDRLGRSLRDLLDVAEALRERYIALRSLTEHIDTSTAAGKMLYAVLGAVAQFERDVLRERTVAGMRAAKSRGEHIGRPPALSPLQIREAKKMLDRGESPNHVARVLRVGRSTLYRAIHEVRATPGRTLEPAARPTWCDKHRILYPTGRQQQRLQMALGARI
jgi:DNA invertase Pin-like site-specific DNA recombinase